MTLTFATAAQTRLQRQVIMLLIIVFVAWIAIIARVTEAVGQTLFLSLFVAVTGLGLITRLARRLDAAIQKLGYVYLLKLPVVLFVL